MSERFIEPVSLAAELSITTRTLRRWEDSGKIPRAVRLSGKGGKVLYDRAAVERVIAVGRRAPDEVVKR